MKVKDIMIKDVVTLAPDDTFYDIVEIFAEKKISGAPVTNGKVPIGMISESDIMKFVSHKNLVSLIEHEDKKIKDKASMKAKHFMTKKLISVKPGDRLGEVIKLLNEKDINRVPVIEKGKLVGIITRADVVSVVSEYLTEHPLMRKMELETDEPRLETNIDRLLSVVKSKGTVDMKVLAKKFNVDVEKIEEWGRILEDYKLVRLHYPPIGDPKIKLYKESKDARKN